MSCPRHADGRHVQLDDGRTEPYEGPVTNDQTRVNRAAHGNVTYVWTCACGWELRRNVNGLHTEIGDWERPRGPVVLPGKVGMPNPVQMPGKVKMRPDE